MPKRTSAPPPASGPVDNRSGFDETNRGPLADDDDRPIKDTGPAAKLPHAKMAGPDRDPADDQMDDLESIGERADEIQLGSLDDAAEYLKVLYYGAEGTTKSTSAAMMTTLPGKGRVLIVNAEAGLKKRALRDRGVDTARIATFPLEGQRVTFDSLERLFFRISGDLERDPDSWAGVIWDSATDIHQELLDQVVEQEMAVQAQIIARNKGNRPGNIKLRDRFDNDRDDYRRMSNQFRQLLRKYRYLPCHFVVTALLRRDEDDRSKKVSYGPAVTPALQSDLLGYMDVVVYTQVAKIRGESVFFGQTAPEADSRAKDRFNVLPVELVNPTFSRIHAYVAGILTADNDPDQKLLGGPDPAATADANRAAVRADVAGDPVPVATKPARARVSSKRGTTAPAPAVVGSPDDTPPF